VSAAAISAVGRGLDWPLSISLPAVVVAVEALRHE
jgi:hypothetical protein